MGFYRIKKKRLSYPAWLGREEFHLSHRSNLLRKDYNHYKQYFDEPTNLPFLVVTFISSLFVFKGIEGFLFMFYIVAVMFIGMYFGKKATLNQVVSLIKKIKKEESR